MRKDITANPVAYTTLGPDTTACADFFLINASTPDAYYRWQDGSLNPVLLIDHTGMYWVDITKDGCTVRDSIYVEFLPTPVFTLGNDTTLCEGQRLELVVKKEADHYEWQDGSQNAGYTVTEAGNYSTTASFQGCEYTDDINVYYTVIPEPYLGADTLLCLGSVLILKVDAENFTSYWSNGSTASSLPVSESGTYWIDLSLGSCSATDSIQVEFVHCTIEMPNFFSPNPDEYNQLFIPMEMAGISYAQLMIYDRWGKEIYTTNDLVKGWDGNSNGSTVSSGVYFWKVQYIDIANKTHTIKGPVTVSR